MFAERTLNQKSGRVRARVELKKCPLGSAAQSALEFLALVGFTDHPRECGANASPTVAPSAGFGSSPRVRGKPSLPFDTLIIDRIIPACAGQTDMRYTTSLASSGSSPRVRGKQPQAAADGDEGRIIPACAGQTRGRDRQHDARPDHPRACGANVQFCELSVAEGGSSPRVRGKQAPHLTAASSIRIIPACAGQTALVAWVVIMWADHPRVCGANG